MNEAALGIHLFLRDSASSELRGFSNALLGILYTSRAFGSGLGEADTAMGRLRKSIAANEAALVTYRNGIAETQAAMSQLYNETATLSAGGPIYTTAQEGRLKQYQVDLSRLQQEEIDLAAEHTRLTAMLGTPLYSASEQARMDQYSIDMQRLFDKEVLLEAEHEKLVLAMGIPLYTTTEEGRMTQLLIDLQRLQDEETRLIQVGVKLLDEQSKVPVGSAEWVKYESQIQRTENALTRVGMKLDDTELKIQTLTDVGINRQTAALEKNEAQIVSNSNAMTDLQERMDLLRANGIQATNDALATNDAALQSVSSSVDDLRLKMDTLVTQGYEAQAAAIDKNNAKLAEYQAVLTETQAKEAETAAAIDTQNVKLKEQQTAANLAGTGMGMLIAGGIGIFGFGAAIAYSVKQAQDLQVVMVQVGLGTKATGAQLDQLQTIITNLADHSIYSSKEIAEGFFMLGERGFDAAHIIQYNMGDALVRFAASTRSDVKPAADLLASAMRTFGMDASQAGKAADILTNIFHNGTPDVNQFKQGLSQAGGMAAQAGWSLKDLGVANDFYAEKAMSSSKAGTLVNAALTTMINPTLQAEKALTQLGIISINKTAPALVGLEQSLRNTGKQGAAVANGFDGTLTSLQSMFTSAQKLGAIHTDMTFYQWAISSGVLKDKLFDASGNLKNMNGLVQVFGEQVKNIHNPQELNSLLASLGGQRSGKFFEILMKDAPGSAKELARLAGIMDQTGTAAHNAAENNNTYDAKMKQLGTTVQTLGATIGGPLLGPMKQMLQQFNDFLANLMQSNPAVGQMGAKFLLVGLGVSILLVVFGGLLMMVAQLPAMITGLSVVFGGLGGAIATVSGFLFATPIGWILIGIVALIAGIVLLQMKFGLFTGAINWVMDALRPFGAFIGGQLQKMLGDLGHVFTDNVGPAISQLATAFHNAQPALAWVPPVVKVIAAVLLSVLAGAFMGVLNGLFQFLKGVFQVIAGLIVIVSGIITFFMGFFSLLHGIFTGNGKEIQTAWHTMLSGIWTAVSGWGLVIQGLFRATVGVVIGILQGLVTGATGMFMHLLGIGDQSTLQMKLKVEQHMLEMKQKSIEHSIDMGQKVIQNMQKQREGVLNELKNCKTEAERHALEMKLRHIDLAIQQQVGVVNAEKQKRAQVIAEQLRLKQEAIEANKSMWGRVQDAWNNGVNTVKNTLTSWWNNIATFFTTTIPNTVKTSFNNLANSATQFGQSLLQNFINGLQSKLGDLGGMVNQIAEKVLGPLAHHSPAKEGPLKDDDKWMPNMMNMHIAGIAAGIPGIKNVVGQMSAALIPQLPTASSVRLAQGGVTSPALQHISGSYPHGGAASGQNITHVQVMLDSKCVAEKFHDNIMGDLKMNGYQRVGR